MESLQGVFHSEILSHISTNKLKQIMVLTCRLGDHKDHISIGSVRTIKCRVSCNIAHSLRVGVFGPVRLVVFCKWEIVVVTLV